MPMPASTIPLRARLVPTAVQPLVKANGATGKMAPKAKRKKEAVAAPQAEPPKASGSMPSSSRARVSSAVDLSESSRSANALA